MMESLEYIDRKLHAVAAPEGEPVPHKVRFCTPTVGFRRLPDFPYVASALNANHITYTAILHVFSVDDIEPALSQFFDKPAVQRVTVDEINFTHHDCMPGASIWGLIPATTRPSLLRSILCFWK